MFSQAILPHCEFHLWKPKWKSLMSNFYVILSEKNCQEAWRVITPEWNINGSREPTKMKIWISHSGLLDRNPDALWKIQTIWFAICHSGRWNTNVNLFSWIYSCKKKMPVKHDFLRFVFLFPCTVWNENRFSHLLVLTLSNGSSIDIGPWLPNNLIFPQRTSQSEQICFLFQPFTHLKITLGEPVNFSSQRCTPRFLLISPLVVCVL